jgi:hypothetical protein
MTWGGTKIFFSEIVTLETGDMPQKVFLVFFGPIEGRWQWHPVKTKNSKIIFLSPPWVAVLKL